MTSGREIGGAGIFRGFVVSEDSSAEQTQAEAKKDGPVMAQRQAFHRYIHTSVQSRRKAPPASPHQTSSPRAPSKTSSSRRHKTTHAQGAKHHAKGHKGRNAKSAHAKHGAKKVAKQHQFRAV